MGPKKEAQGGPFGFPQLPDRRVRPVGSQDLLPGNKGLEGTASSRARRGSDWIFRKILSLKDIGAGCPG